MLRFITVFTFLVFSSDFRYMAHIQQKSIDRVGLEGPGLVFIVYPEAIAMMSGSVFWSIIFFLMLITLGIDSTFGGLEAMITALCDEYPRALGRRREIFVLGLLICIYLCALPTTTYVSRRFVVLVFENSFVCNFLFQVLFVIWTDKNLLFRLFFLGILVHFIERCYTYSCVYSCSKCVLGSASARYTMRKSNKHDTLMEKWEARKPTTQALIPLCVVCVHKSTHTQCSH